jgi:small subunit ribosomal protein S16
MVVIRLARGGAKKRPFYHVVVADKRCARDGRKLETLGYFNPIAAGSEKRLELNVARLQEWVSKGAQPSERVKKLVVEFEKSGAQSA